MMKEYKDDSSLQRVLHSRQLGLKLIANVTYGYTSANYSGRMPCSEVGRPLQDIPVQLGDGTAIVSNCYFVDSRFHC